MTLQEANPPPCLHVSGVLESLVWVSDLWKLIFSRDDPSGSPRVLASRRMRLICSTLTESSENHGRNFVHQKTQIKIQMHMVLPIAVNTTCRHDGGFCVSNWINEPPIGKQSISGWKNQSFMKHHFLQKKICLMKASIFSIQKSIDNQNIEFSDEREFFSWKIDFS